MNFLTRHTHTLLFKTALIIITHKYFGIWDGAKCSHFLFWLQHVQYDCSIWNADGLLRVFRVIFCVRSKNACHSFNGLQSYIIYAFEFNFIEDYTVLISRSCCPFNCIPAICVIRSPKCLFIFIIEQKCCVKPMKLKQGIVLTAITSLFVLLLRLKPLWRLIMSWKSAANVLSVF